MQLSKNSARALTCTATTFFASNDCVTVWLAGQRKIFTLPTSTFFASNDCVTVWLAGQRKIFSLPTSCFFANKMIVLLCDWQDSARSSVCPLPVSLPNECTPRAQSSHLTAARRAPAGYVTSVSCCHSISVPAVILFPVPAVILLSLRLAQLSFESAVAYCCCYYVGLINLVISLDEYIAGSPFCLC